MKKFSRDWKEKTAEFSIVPRYWLPVFLEAFYSTLRIGFNYIEITVLGTIYSGIITLRKGEDMSNILIPHFWEGFGLAVLTVFVGNLFMESAKKMRGMDVEAKRVTWKDIEIVKHSFPEGSGYGLGLQITSHKPEPDRNFGDRFRVNLTKAKIHSISQRGQRSEYSSDMEYGMPILYERGSVYSEEGYGDLPHLGNVKWNKMVLLIAEYQDERAVIIEKQENTNKRRELATIDRDNSCWIEIRLNAMVPFGIAMEECVVSFNIYNKQTGLEIANLQRSPEYEK